MKFKYSEAIFWLFLFALAAGAYMLLSAQNITRASFIKNEGIVISAEDCEDIEPIRLNIVNQQDSRWGMKIMCDDLSIRICEYGSQLCCVSSIYGLFDIGTAPDKLYDTFEANGLYITEDTTKLSSTPPYEFSDRMYSITFESPRLESKAIFDSETVISVLKSGTPVMVRTEGIMSERFWVVITGVQDGEFIIMSPIADEYDKLSSFKNRIYQMYYFD